MSWQKEVMYPGVPVELVVNRTIAKGLAQEPFAGKIRKLKPYRHFKVWTVSEAAPSGNYGDGQTSLSWLKQEKSRCI